MCTFVPCATGITCAQDERFPSNFDDISGERKSAQSHVAKKFCSMPRCALPNPRMSKTTERGALHEVLFGDVPPKALSLGCFSVLNFLA